MNIGIIGAGRMGSALGKAWARAGHDIMYSFSRDGAKLDRLANETHGASAGTPFNTAVFADVLLLAVPLDALDLALDQIHSNAAKPVITTVSPFRADLQGTETRIAGPFEDVSAAEYISSRLPDAQVVEAFNLVFADLLATGSTWFGEERPTVPLCGDDDDAKAVVEQLIADAGLRPLDAGALDRARSLELLATAWVQFAAVSDLYPRTGLHVLTRRHDG